MPYSVIGSATDFDSVSVQVQILVGQPILQLQVHEQKCICPLK